MLHTKLERHPSERPIPPGTSGLASQVHSTALGELPSHSSSRSSSRHWLDVVFPETADRKALGSVLCPLTIYLLASFGGGLSISASGTFVIVGDGDWRSNSFPTGSGRAAAFARATFRKCSGVKPRGPGNFPNTARSSDFVRRTPRDTYGFS